MVHMRLHLLVTTSVCILRTGQSSSDITHRTYLWFQPNEANSVTMFPSTDVIMETTVIGLSQSEPRFYDNN